MDGRVADVRVLDSIRVGGLPQLSPRDRVVLGALVLQRGASVSTDLLADAIWGDAVPDSWRKVVQGSVVRLRKVLGRGAVETTSVGYQLSLCDNQVDAWRFDALVNEACDTRDLHKVVHFLDDALDLWRDDPFSELARWPPAAGEITRLQEQHSTAEEQRLEALLGLGRLEQAIATATELTATDPFRERRWELLALALYRAGRQADALRALSQARGVLRDEMGVDPRPESVDLERAILNHDPELTTSGQPQSAWSGERSHDKGTTFRHPRIGLQGVDPGTLSMRFFGREAEVAELSALVEESRLVTLVGAPGCGKTRLAIQVGSRLVSEFPGGVWFVDLASVNDPASVAGAVGVALGIDEERDRARADTLTAELADSVEPLLVLLDNCEQVVDAVAELVDSLVAKCPSVRVVATSRAVLGLAVEWVWQVPPLDPSSTERLFVGRASLASNSFSADGAEAATVKEICQRLDGLPLAIELAAAWARVLSPGQILERLADKRLQLARGGRAKPLRHETMVATVDWSLRLLPPDVQKLFDRLAVFAGGFDLDAAAAVSESDDEDVLNGLRTLVDHSLVVTQGTSGGPMRYRLLEPVRQVGAAHLVERGENDAVQSLHADHYLALARRLDPWGVRGADQPVPLHRVEQDGCNMMAALAWAHRQSPDLALRLCEALRPFWEWGGRVNDGRAWLEDLLADGTPDDKLRADALASAGRLAWRQGDTKEARRSFEDGLVLTRQLADEKSSAGMLCGLATVAFSEGDADAAVRCCHESLALCRSVGDESYRAVALTALGWAHYIQGDISGGNAHEWAAAEASRAAGTPAMIAVAHISLHYGAFLAGDAVAQRTHIVQALTAMEQAGGFYEELDWLVSGAVLASVERRADASLRLLGGAGARRRRLGNRVPAQIAKATWPVFDWIFQQTDLDRAEQLQTEGTQMSWDELVVEALTEPEVP